MEVDPHSERNLSRTRHRQVYDQLTARVPGLEPGFAAALYERMLDTWVPYDDAPPLLEALRARGVKVALVSNAGVDVRVVLERRGLAPLFDAVVVSHEIGAVKPGKAIFERALEALGVPAERALMVGDNPRDDFGAAFLGIHTLILPRTHGPVHGLDLVLRLVGG